MSWNKLEKLALAYKRKPTATAALALDRGMRRYRAFVETLSEHFVRTQNSLEDCSASFRFSEDGQFPEWACRFDEERRVFELNPVGVISFHDECVRAQEALQTQEGRESFSLYRLYAYMAELNKLPSKFLPFLMLFREKARVLEVTQVERRRGNITPIVVDSEEDMYLCLLWAFKELEVAIRHLSGVNLRTELNITWFESEWITGVK
ncbi:MAG: hypothetical protein GX945_12770 [Lentisphaerae bacterium]|jgi:hypothetical protein|nr:hypothetical protein [Lentisphaerota bacterium]